MSPLILSLPGMECLSAGIAAGLGASSGNVVVHRFSDGECRVRVDPGVRDEDVVLVSRLDRPDDKLLPLLFAAKTARELGAESVGLVAPYVPYLRQDGRFQPGEGISARFFSDFLSETVDWLVTVDPHLHRIRKLERLFSIPVESVHAAPLMADWVRTKVKNPMLIGPDDESMQWVEALANRLGVPHAVLSKRRLNDRSVELRLPDLNVCLGHQPVLVDDIIASGATMLQAIRLLRRAGWPSPACLAVHPVFADDAYGALQAAGAIRIATCDTIPHPSNAIDVADLLAVAITRLVRRSEVSAFQFELAERNDTDTVGMKAGERLEPGAEWAS